LSGFGNLFLFARVERIRELGVGVGFRFEEAALAGGSGELDGREAGGEEGKKTHRLIVSLIYCGG